MKQCGGCWKYFRKTGAKGSCPYCSSVKIGDLLLSYEPSRLNDSLIFVRVLNEPVKRQCYECYHYFPNGKKCPKCNSIEVGKIITFSGTTYRGNGAFWWNEIVKEDKMGINPIETGKWWPKMY